MLAGICLSFGAVIGWVTNGTAYKLSVLRGCSREAVLIVERIVVIVGVSIALLWLGNVQWSVHALLLGVGGGVFLFIGRRNYLSGLRYGSASLAWLILNFSIALPVLIAILLFKEAPSGSQFIGMILIGVTLFGLKEGDRFSDQNVKPSMDNLVELKEHDHTYWKWIILISSASLFEGIFISFFLLVREFGLDESRNLFVMGYNFTFLILALGLRRPKLFDLPTSDEVRIGFLGGLGIIAASLCGIYGIFLLPAIIFLPLTSSGSLIGFTIISIVLWGEVLKRRRWVFLGIGMTAIILVCIP